MNLKMALLALTAPCVIMGNAFGADWKFFGKFTSAPNMEAALFYDATSIINRNNSIKLWTKIVSYRDLEKGLENKAIFEKASAESAQGYDPADTKTHSSLTNAAFLEEVASNSSIRSKAEILYQLACNERLYRKISGAAANKDGVLNQRFGIGTWEPIEPGSNADNLAKAVCPK